MKSGIVTRRDPYLMDPSFLVDPNLILDYGSSKDEAHYHPYNLIDPLMDLINCNDTQLENIILDSGLCGECGDNPWALENEFDLDEILKDKGQSSEIEAQTQVELEALRQVELEMTTCAINESEVANYEEVYAEEVDNVHDTSGEQEANDCESVHSFCTESSDCSLKPESPKQTAPKRKLGNVKEVGTGNSAPKRRKVTRRTKRVQDDRVKNQNKVAALKYRKKKREEKTSLDDLIEIEEEKNKKLKAEVDELKVNIDVLKELLGKYLSPNQLKVKKQ